MGSNNNNGKLELPKSRKCSQTSLHREHIPNRIKYFTAAAIFYGNITFGLVYTNYGPALTTLQNKYNTNDATISKVFIFMAAGNMIGALSAGLIYNHVNRQLAVILIFSTKALVMFATPHCPTLTTFYMSAGALGLCIGGYDTAQVVWMMEMMQKDCPPYVQAQHFFFALGTNLASLIMAPFLDHETLYDIKTSVEASENVNNNGSFYKIVGNNAKTYGHKLLIPYTIIGTLLLTTVAVHILLYVFMRYSPPPPETEISENLETVNDTETSKSKFKIGGWPLAKVSRVIICVTFFGALQGTEWGLFEFFPKFGQNSDLHLSESQSAYVLSGLSASYTVGRFLAIFAVLKMSPKTILWGNIVVALFATAILAVWANGSLTMFWTSGILFGLGLSSMYGYFTAHFERYLRFTNFIGSCMVGAGTLVGITSPLIVGNFIEHNVEVLSCTSFCGIGVIILAVTVLNKLTLSDKTRY